MRKLNLAAGLFVALALLGLVCGVVVAIRRGYDDGWPSGARFQAVVSGIHIIVLSLVSAVAGVVGLRRRRRAAWFTLVIVGVIGWAAWPLASVLSGEAPAAWFSAVTFGALAAALFALAISFRPNFDAEGEAGGRPSGPPIGE